MSEIGDIIRDIEHTLLSRGAHHALVFSDVGNIKGSGRYSSGDCPVCGKADKFRISNERAVSSCWSGSCSWSGSWHNWLEYAQRQGRASSWLDFYKELAREAGIEWPEPDAQSQARYQARKERESLLEDAGRLMVEALQQPEGAAALAYWRSRGYSDEHIKDMELGAYPGQQRLLQGLLALGHDEPTIRAADLIERKWDERPAMMLWRDRAGQAAGLMGRAIQPDIEPKYLYSKGLSKSHMLPGLERARQHEELILVESPLAAAFLNAQQMSRPVVALGGSNLSRAQIEALQQARAKRLILALDADKAGQEGTEKAIKALLESQGIERLLVATWPEEQGSGLDDYTQGQGLEAAEAAVKRAARVGSWMARRLASTLPEDAEPLEEEALLEQAVEEYLRLSRGDKLQARDYVEALAEELGWDEQLLWPRMAEAEKRLREKESRQNVEAQLAAAGAALSRGDRAALLEAIETAGRAARGSGVTALPEPYPLERLLADIAQEPLALATGWPSVDAEIVGFPRAALSVIAGPTGQGKTTLMLNLLVRWSQRYPEETFYFYSYEEPASHIALKLIMIRAGVTINGTDNQGAYRNYLRFHRAQNSRPFELDEKKQARIEEAIQWYQERAASGRIILDYSMPTVEELADTLALIGKRGGVGAVLLDYIQRVPISRSGQSRQLELAYATQLLRHAAVSERLAIITGSQVTDSGEIREARDIHHEAGLALKIKSRKDEDDGEEPDMSIYVLKNRNGRAGSTIYMQYAREILSLIDKQGQAAAGGRFH
jgi:DNA primase